jgi:hypothetical protein
MHVVIDNQEYFSENDFSKGVCEAQNLERVYFHPFYSMIAQHSNLDIQKIISTFPLKINGEMIKNNNTIVVRYNTLEDFVKAIVLCERDEGMSWSFFFQYSGICMGTLYNKETDISATFMSNLEYGESSIAVTKGEMSFTGLVNEVNDLYNIVNNP